MAKNIEPNLKYISDYFKLKKRENFLIPEYQREYSWNLTQCEKLWQDVESFIEYSAEDPYFFGTIIVDCSEDNKLSLIDGQQRTTTFLLLLKALLIRLNGALLAIPSNDEESEGLKVGLTALRNKIVTILYKVEDDEIPAILKDNSKVKNILLMENKSINEPHSDELKKILASKDFDEAELDVHKEPNKKSDKTKYTAYFRNFKYFHKMLGEKSGSQLNMFAKTFLGRCQIIEIRSWQIEQAITMFNSLNSTGMPLSDANIISAQMFSNAGDKKDVFNKQWEEINQLAGKLNALKIVDIDALLQQFMYYNRAINGEYMKGGYVDVVTPALRRYYTIDKKELLDKPLDLCDNLTKLAQIWDEIKDFPIVKLLLKFNENAKLYLSSYLYRYNVDDITEEKTLDICECLLRLFAILEVVDAGYSSKNFKSFLFGEMQTLANKNITIDEIKRDFDEHINNNWKKDGNTDDIGLAILEYRKNALVYLNEYLYAKKHKKKFDFDSSVTIEHVMPTSGRDKDSIRKDAKIEKMEDFYTIANELGNKILLEEDINKSLGNAWFRTKKYNSIKEKEEGAKGYKDSKYLIACALTKYQNDVWDKYDIAIATGKATERIIQFIFNSQPETDKNSLNLFHL